MNKNEVLRIAAKEFAEKARKLSSVLEIAIVGSVAGKDPYPNDLDLAVIVCNLDELTTLAKYARQMSSHGIWKAFLFDEGLKLLGEVCYRRECPGQSVDCYTTGCGQPPYLMVRPEFEYDEKMFLESPIDVLWTCSGMSHLLARRDELGIIEPRKYPVLYDIGIECIICGKKFVFTAEEQKWYQKMGFSRPKRCPDCRARMHMEELGIDER